MTHNTFSLIGIAVLVSTLSACVIKHPGHDEDCASNPAYCDDRGTNVTCWSDVDCGPGCYCAINQCVVSTACSDGRTCPTGFRCDARQTCVPTTGSGGSGVGGAGATGGFSGSAGAGGRGGGLGRGGAGAASAVGSGGARAATGTGGAATATGSGGAGATSGPGSVMCRGNADCAAADCCVSGSCQPRPDTGAPLCRFNSECGATGRCRNGACEGACIVAADCGTGDICVGGYCRENPASVGTCVYNVDCGATGSGAVCLNGTCHPACQTDTQCGPHDRCQAGVCQPDRRPQPGCRANVDCGGARICVNAACRTACASNADCCNCGTASVCQGGLCVTPGEAAPQCRVTTECGPLQSCVDAICGL